MTYDKENKNHKNIVTANIILHITITHIYYIFYPKHLFNFRINDI